MLVVMAALYNIFFVGYLSLYLLDYIHDDGLRYYLSAFFVLLQILLFFAKKRGGRRDEPLDGALVPNPKPPKGSPPASSHADPEMVQFMKDLNEAKAKKEREKVLVEP